jgi:hypothetical protein
MALLIRMKISLYLAMLSGLALAALPSTGSSDLSMVNSFALLLNPLFKCTNNSTCR